MELDDGAPRWISAVEDLLLSDPLSEEERSPEWLLWFAVLRVAIIDAINGGRIEKKFARIWLFNDRRTTIGSVLWIVDVLGIEYLPEIREMVLKAKKGSPFKWQA